MVLFLLDSSHAEDLNTTKSKGWSVEHIELYISFIFHSWNKNENFTDTYGELDFMENINVQMLFKTEWVCDLLSPQ